MELGLKLAEIDESLTDVEIRPGKVERWLESLPVLNLSETSSKIRLALNNTNRTAMDDKTRLRLLETFRQPIGEMCTELEKDFLGQSLPLPTKGQMSANRTLELLQELAKGYKFLIQSEARELDAVPRDKQRKYLALIIDRALHALSMSLYESYLAYYPVPPGVWHEIHKLHRFAQKLEANDLEVEDPLNPTGSTTVSRTYKQAILLELSNPYHLPGRSIRDIRQCLGKWSELATLTNATGVPGNSCQFLIDKKRDTAGEVFNGQAVDPATIPNYLMLNTLELAKHVHRQLKALQENKAPVEDGTNHGIYTEENSRELLTNLVNAWGVNPKRNFRRISRKGDQVYLAIGIKSINFWLNDGEKLILSSEFVGPMPQKSKVGTLYANIEIDDKPVSNELEENPELDFVVWDVIDESAGGLAVSTSNPRHQKAKVGDIIGLRAGQNAKWEIVVAKWIKNLAHGVISMGVQRLAPTATPVAINVVNGEGTESGFHEALLLPELPTLKQPASLITEKSTLNQGKGLFLDDGFRMNEVRAVRALDGTTAYERFQYEVIRGQAMSGQA